MDKKAIVDRIVEHLAAEYATVIEAARSAHESAIGDEAKAEGKYDTRALESSYLAEGQARLAEDLRAALHLYRSLKLKTFLPGEPIALTALVGLEQSDDNALYFIGPRNGGLVITHAGREVLVVTPQSPIGRALLGKTEGGIVCLDVAGVSRQARIARIE